MRWTLWLKLIQKNKTKEMTDAITNVMMWLVAEVVDIIYPAIIQYEERKIPERDEEAHATKFVFTDRKKTATNSPGCVKTGSRGKLTPLVSQVTWPVSDTKQATASRQKVLGRISSRG
ncbi:hypothetical protein Y1Q_0009505 [Alligator mississippiensis]|uniref:Uncharacterized protein n=1 Tax=Alligator mississippiensis TaxID=8496 RepID=A0A151NUJ9_ALLMI|nr:hypothetical protein Y1Q_0009505 [Alligator mississippiensis]